MTMSHILGNVKRMPKFKELEELLRKREEAIYRKGYEDGVKHTRAEQKLFLREWKKIKNDNN